MPSVGDLLGHVQDSRIGFEDERHGCAVGVVVDAQLTFMHQGDMLGKSQTQAQLPMLGGKKGLDHVRLHIGSDGAARIGDRQADGVLACLLQRDCRAENSLGCTSRRRRATALALADFYAPKPVQAQQKKLRFDALMRGLRLAHAGDELVQGAGHLAYGLAHGLLECPGIAMLPKPQGCDLNAHRKAAQRRAQRMDEGWQHLFEGLAPHERCRHRRRRAQILRVFGQGALRPISRSGPPRWQQRHRL